jgi:hypothetical protein
MADTSQAQRAGDGDRLGSPWPRGDAVSLPVTTTEQLEDVVLRRGSQRRMDRTRRLRQHVVGFSMAAATRGVDVSHWLAVHSVDNIPPGLYLWPRLATPLRVSDLRDEMYVLCMEQGLGSEAAFVVVAAAKLDQLYDREYREAQLVAGLVMGRLHLLAYGLGAGASGMTFYDSEIPKLLGDGLSGLVLTCVGVPEYTSARGGLPGAPTAVRMVRPRIAD